MFYTFDQNNSGGIFDYDENRGISVNVIIEADSVEDALSRAESIGLYFDGDGDCECCGRRWSDYVWNSGSEVPSIYGTPISFSDDAQLGGAWSFKWINDGYEAFVHYKDGRVVGAYR